MTSEHSDVTNKLSKHLNKSWGNVVFWHWNRSYSCCILNLRCVCRKVGKCYFQTPALWWDVFQKKDEHIFTHFMGWTPAFLQKIIFPKSPVKKSPPNCWGTSFNPQNPPTKNHKNPRRWDCDEETQHHFYRCDVTRKALYRSRGDKLPWAQDCPNISRVQLFPKASLSDTSKRSKIIEKNSSIDWKTRWIVFFGSPCRIW